MTEHRTMQDVDAAFRDIVERLAVDAPSAVDAPAPDRAVGATQPVAQGDLLFVPADRIPRSEQMWPTRLARITSAGAVLVDGEHRHRATGEGSWGTGFRGKAPSSLVAAIEASGVVAVEHTGHHQPVVLAAGRWLVFRQTAPDTRVQRVQGTQQRWVVD